MDRRREARLLLVLAARSLELVRRAHLSQSDRLSSVRRLEVEEVVGANAKDVVRVDVRLVLEDDGGDVDRVGEQLGGGGDRVVARL